jgi:hypothetical protein
MKRIILVTLLVSETTWMVVAVTSPASAIYRVSSVGRTCATLRSIIDQQGAVLVTHPGTGGAGTLYDRYVSWQGLCGPGYVTEDGWVPAKDGQCRLSRCEIFESPH